ILRQSSVTSCWYCQARRSVDQLNAIGMRWLPCRSMSTTTAPQSGYEARTCCAGGALTMTSTQNTNAPHPHSTIPTRPPEPAPEEARAAEDFTTSAGLRALLDRLHAAGP